MSGLCKLDHTNKFRAYASLIIHTAACSCLPNPPPSLFFSPPILHIARTQTRAQRAREIERRICAQIRNHARNHRKHKNTIRTQTRARAETESHTQVRAPAEAAHRRSIGAAQGHTHAHDGSGSMKAAAARTCISGVCPGGARDADRGGRSACQRERERKGEGDGEEEEEREREREREREKCRICLLN